jgi:hypothetical protein
MALWTYEHSQVWLKFTALIYANTIVLATIGVVATSDRAANLVAFRIVLAALGLLICTAWVFLTKRSFDYCRYWILSARELEEKYLTPVQTLQRGGEFAGGKPIQFELSDPTLRALQLGLLARVGVQPLSYGLIIIFAALHLATIVLLN